MARYSEYEGWVTKIKGYEERDGKTFTNFYTTDKKVGLVGLLIGAMTFSLPQTIERAFPSKLSRSLVGQKIKVSYAFDNDAYVLAVINGRRAGRESYICFPRSFSS